MDFPITDRIFCWIFEVIIGGEIYQTTDDNWVVRCNGDLYNKNGYIYNAPELAHWVSFEHEHKTLWAELSALDLGNKTNGEAFDDIAEYAEELFEDREDYKAEKMAEVITKKHELWSPKMLEDNYFSMTSTNKNQAYFMYLYSEHDVDDIDRFLSYSEEFSSFDLIPNIYASGKVLWENKVNYVYLIYEKDSKMISFDTVNIKKMKDQIKEKVSQAIQEFEQKLKKYDLCVPWVHPNLFYLNRGRGALNFYMKSPISIYKACNLINMESLGGRLLE